MTDKELKEIRQKISCPQLNDKHYGEWGALRKDQRFTIKRMLDFIDAQEQYINRLQAENERLTHITRNLVGEIKAEAYTEFAERWKAYLLLHHGEIYGALLEGIDNLLKEMVNKDE